MPRADCTGPTNVAVDIGTAAIAAGWRVRLLYLSDRPSRDDLARFAEVRRWRWSDLWTLEGVVHTHGLRPDIVGWLLTWSTRRILATTLHGHFPHHLSFDYPNWKVHLTWLIWRSLLPRFAVRFCISRTMHRYYRRALPALQFDIAYNFRSQPSIPKSAPEAVVRWVASQRGAGRTILCYVGSISQRKNLLPLLREIARSPNLALAVCGRGPLLAEAQRFVATEIEDDRISVLGSVSMPEEIMRACDMLVLPSFAEGLPLVVLEAASVGRPSLMSDIAVHRELASYGLGAVFDHRKFSNFRSQVSALVPEPDSPPNPALIHLWQQQFSDAAGFDVLKRALCRVAKTRATPR